LQQHPVLDPRKDCSYYPKPAVTLEQHSLIGKSPHDKITPKQEQYLMGTDKDFSRVTLQNQNRYNDKPDHNLTNTA
jgi:hypothetical protein